MGSDARRGFPYTWLPSHLADALRQVSPRSFLSALRSAASETEDRYAAHPCALHYEAIKRGVQAASKIRVRETTEDHPWVAEVMAPLENLLIPCDEAELVLRWKTAHIVERQAALGGQLPPSLSDREAGLLRDLVSIGVCESPRSGRVNLPDVYRVGYRLLRKGGVKPLPRG
jgi:hypothetical protein